MKTEVEAKIEALQHAICVCKSKRLPNRTPGYLAALDEIEVSLGAVIGCIWLVGRFKF